LIELTNENKLQGQKGFNNGFGVEWRRSWRCQVFLHAKSRCLVTDLKSEEQLAEYLNNLKSLK